MMLRVWSWAADREAAGALTEGSHEKQGKAGREAAVWKEPYSSREILKSLADADCLEGPLPKSAAPCRPRPTSHGRASQLGCQSLAG